MGMEAEVIGIGLFKKELADSLDYPSDFYDETNEGSLVTASFFHCRTSDSSRRLAGALGMETWDFNAHRITSLDKIDWKLLYELAEGYCWVEEKDFEGFKKCFEAGFTLMYIPNG